MNWQHSRSASTRVKWLHWRVVWPYKWLLPSWAAQTHTQFPKGRAKHEHVCAQTLLKLQLLPSELWLTASKTAHKVLLWFESLNFYNWQDFFFPLKTKSEQSLPSSHQQKVKTLRRTAFSYHMLPSKSWASLCTLTVISHIDMAAKQGLFDVLSCLCNGVSF